MIERDLDELVVERKVIEMMASARWVREIQIINALKPGNITRALNGEHLGTVIYATDQGHRAVIPATHDSDRHPLVAASILAA